MQNGNEEITVELVEYFKGVEFDWGRLKKMAVSICRQFGLSSAMVSVVVLDDESMRKANKRFLKKDAVTDVISFDLSDEDKAERNFELVINGERARKEGESRGHKPEGELALYVVHGLLHNLGFDDSDETKAEKMHRQEDEILQQFDYKIE
jgi:probable rRNA maturation factor